MSPVIRCTCGAETEVLAGQVRSCLSCGKALPAAAGQAGNPAASGLSLRSVRTGAVIDLPIRGTITLGREKEGARVLGSMLDVSRTQCLVFRLDGRHFVADAGSTHNTFVGPQRLECRSEPRLLADGGLLWLGPEQFTVSLRGPRAEASAAEAPVEPRAAVETATVALPRICDVCTGEVAASIDRCPQCGNVMPPPRGQGR